MRRFVPEQTCERLYLGTDGRILQLDLAGDQFGSRLATTRALKTGRAPSIAGDDFRDRRNPQPLRAIQLRLDGPAYFRLYSTITKLLFDQIQEFELSFPRFRRPNTSQFDALHESIDMSSSLADSNYSPTQIAKDFPEPRRFGIDGSSARFLVSAKEIFA